MAHAHSKSKVCPENVCVRTVKKEECPERKREREMAEGSCSGSQKEEREKRPTFGGRKLEDASRVLEHNAWDDVEWDEERKREAEEKVTQNSKQPVPDEDRKKFEDEAAGYWDSFYGQHQNRFFKDRHWLFTEFPELSPSRTPLSVAKHTNVWEIGCGAGNTVFPLLQTNKDEGLFVYCSDFSKTAVSLVQENPLYADGRCQAFQCDVTSPESHPHPPFPPSSIDIVILIFVLSAIQPSKMQEAINWICSFLSPGGLLLFRDYGRHDMAQLRFKQGRCLGDNFYVRGDGTRVYFFTEGEVHELMTRAGMEQRQLYVDRRLQVNRGRQVQMYRVWVQAKYTKPLLQDGLQDTHHS